MADISVLINVIEKELPDLSRALKSVKGLASEIILIDMTEGSEIKRIAKKYNATVFTHTLLPYVEPVRNFAISKATKEWVLILDPDEEVPVTLAKKLIELTKDEKHHYWRLPRKNIVFDKWLEYSRWWPDYNIRFFKKGFVTWNEIIHTVPVTQGNGGDLEAKEEYALVHNNYKTVEDYIERMNRYTSVQAKLKIKDDYAFQFKDLLAKPSNEFLSRYFAGNGYKDGIHGLALSLLQAFSELVLYLKVWQLGKFKQEKIETIEVISDMKKIEKDFHYWQADTVIKEGGGITHRIKRKLKLS